MPQQQINPFNMSLVYKLNVRFVEGEVTYTDLMQEIVACIEEGRELNLPAAQLQQKADLDKSDVMQFEKLSIVQSLTRHEEESLDADNDDPDEDDA